MSTISWKYNTDGNWSNAADWSGGILPGASDSVILDTLSYHTITFATISDQIGSLSAVTDSVVVNSGTLGILGAASFAQNLSLNGGTLSLLGATASVTGTFADTAGLMTLGAGTVLTLNGLADFATTNQGTGPEIDGAGTISTLGTTNILSTYANAYTALTLGGGVTWNFGTSVTDAGQIAVGDGNGLTANFNNAAGLTFALTTDSAGIVDGQARNAQNQTVYGSSTFSNAGTLAKTGGTNTSHIYSLFTNTGVVTAATGTIEFDGGGSFGGTLTGAGQIAFGAGTATFASGVALSAGSLLFDGATASFAGPLTDTGSLTLTNGTLTLDSGSNSIASFTQIGNNYDHLDLAGGTLSLTNATLGSGIFEGAGTLSTGGTTNVAGDDNYAYYLGSKATWVNAGTVLQNYYVEVDYASGGGFSIVNQAGAAWDITGDFSLGGNNNNGIGSTFTNAGTFAKTGGTATTQVISAFTSTGTVSAIAGTTLEFDGGGSFSGSITGSGTVAFAAGTYTLQSGLSLTAGTVLFDGGAVTLASNVNFATANYSEVNGSVSLGGNTLTLASAFLGGGAITGPGTIATSGTTTVSGNNGGGVLYLGGGVNVVNSGTINQAYYLYVNYQTGAGFSITNKAGATYNLTGNFNIGGNNSNGIGSSFVNQGTFAKVAGTGVTQVISNFTSTGTVSSLVGNLEFDGGGTLGGTLSGAGVISVASNIMTLSAGVVVTAGEFLLDGGTLALGANTTLANTPLTVDGGPSTIDLEGFNLTLLNGAIASGYLFGPGGTLTTNGTTTVAGYNGYGLTTTGVTWINNGTLNQNQTLYNYSSAGIAETNSATGTYAIQGDFGYGYNNNLAGTFTNAGLFEKAAGTNVSSIYTVFNSTGTIDSVSGNLEFDDGGTFGGTLTGAGSISFGSNTATLAAGTTISVATLNLYNATLVLAGNVTDTNLFVQSTNNFLDLDGHTLTLTGANLSNGTILGPGTVSLKGTTLLAAGNFYFGGGVVVSNSGTVDQNGTVYVNAGIANDFTINNLAGATWDLTNTYYFASNSSGIDCAFNNAGTFTLTGGTSYTLIYAAFDSTGTVTAATGEIAFEDGGVFSGTLNGPGLISFQNNSYSFGSLTAAAGLTTQFYQSSVTLTGSVTNNGTLLVNGNPTSVALGGNNFSLATLDMNQAGSTFYFDQTGTFTTSGTGTIVDWYNNGVMLSIGGGATWSNTGTMDMGGVLQLGDSDVVNGTSAGTLINAAGAVLDFVTDDAAIHQGVYYNGFGTGIASGAVIQNAGTLAKTGGTNTSYIYGTLTSTGTLATTTGTLALENGGAISGLIADGSSIAFGGGTFTNGALTIGGGSTISNSATINANGIVTLGDSSASAANFANSGLFDLGTGGGIAVGGSVGGTFTNTGTVISNPATGRDAIAVSVVNTGTINAASGTLALTGAVTGTGVLDIGAGATLELGGNVAATQGVTFTAATGTLLLDAPASAMETVTGLTAGNAIDFAGITATKASVSTADVLDVYNGNTLVAKLQLAGSYLSDTFTVASDTHGGALVTLSKATTTYKGVNGDWYSTNVWSNAPPNAQTNAIVNSTGAYNLTLNGGETANVLTLALSATQATYQFAGTLNVAQSITMTAGSLSLTGLINGGIFSVSTSATVTFSNGQLNNVAYQGTLDLSENYAYVSLEGTTSLAGAAGHGTGIVNLTGYDSTLYEDGYETLTNATLNIGNNSYTADLRSNDTNGQGAILTLGPSLSITHTGTYATISDSGNAFDAVYNDGTITAGLGGGTFTVTGNDFENDGKIAVSNGDDFSIQSAQFVNTGTLTVSAGTLAITGSLQDTGSITATNSVLDFGTSLTGAELTKIALGGDKLTLTATGTLNEAGGTLAIGTGAKITALTLGGTIENATINPTAGAVTFENGATLNNVTYNGTIATGSGVAVTIDNLLANATIVDSGNGILFGTGAELDKVAYQGTLSLLAGNDVSVLGGLTLTGAGGTGAGAITAAAGNIASVLYFLDSETLSNVTITSGTGSGPGTLGLFLAPAVAAGGTLTLAATTTFNVNSDTTAGFFSTDPNTGLPLNNAIINDGVISIGAGATFLGSEGSVASTTNAGSITLGTGALWSTSLGTLTSSSFTNTAAGVISLGTNAVLLTNGGGMTNAGSISLASGASLTVQGAFSETGTATVASGAIFTIDGATTLASVNGISGAGTLALDGVLNLVNGTFNMNAPGRITNVQIGGEIENGTFLYNAGTVTFAGVSTLNNVTWKGGLNIGAGATVQVENGLTLETASGGTPGVANLSGGGALDYLGSALLDNMTINSSSPNAGTGTPGLADLLELGGTGTTLTLGAHFTLNANAGATTIADVATPAGGVLVNNGNIDVTAGALWIDPSFANVTNNAVITLADNTEFDPTPGSTGSTNFTNTSTGSVVLTSLDNFDVSGSVVNAGLITEGAGSEITAGGNFSNSGMIGMSHGGSLTVAGALVNTGVIYANGSSSDFIEATPGASSCFNNGTLSGGTWVTSTGSTLTLEFGGALTADSADIVLRGTGSVLRSLGSTIQRVESTLATITSAGTLSIQQSRGYTTALALTDNGLLQLQGGTLSAGGIAVGAGAMLNGYGTIASAITNAGTVAAVGGTLTLASAVTGAGSLQIGASAELELATANAENVLFSGAAGELRLDSPTSYTGTLSGFASGDSILLVSTSATKAVLSGSTLTVTLGGGGTETFHVAGNSSTVTLTTASDGSGDTLLTYPAAQAHKAAMRFIAPAATAAQTTIQDMAKGLGIDAALPVMAHNAQAAAAASIPRTDLGILMPIADHTHTAMLPTFRH